MQGFFTELRWILEGKNCRSGTFIRPGGDTKQVSFFMWHKTDFLKRDLLKLLGVLTIC